MNFVHKLSIVWICSIAIASSAELELDFRNELNKGLQRQLDKAKPGDRVEVLPGTYFGSLNIREGVSLYGKNPDQCKIIGNVVVERKLVKAQTNIQGLTFYHQGGRSVPGLKLDSVNVRIQNCIIASKNGFSAISANDAAILFIKNSIAVGSRAGYALFSRKHGKISLQNCNVVCRGFGVGLMDGSEAVIRYSLFTGDNPGVISTEAVFTVSHSNFSLDGGGYYYGHEFINDDVKLPPPTRREKGALPKDISNRDDEKYKGEGITLFSHTPPTELSVAAFRERSGHAPSRRAA